MNEMKQMPYKVEEGALEQAKYRAKLAVREVAHPIAHRSHKWRWVSVAAVVTVVVVGVISFVKYYDEFAKPQSKMEYLIAEMEKAPDEVVVEWATDAEYYHEDLELL
jgi:low affinity Fe/Cu permease